MLSLSSRIRVNNENYSAIKLSILKRPTDSNMNIIAWNELGINWDIPNFTSKSNSKFYNHGKTITLFTKQAEGHLR